VVARQATLHGRLSSASARSVLELCSATDPTHTPAQKESPDLVLTPVLYCGGVFVWGFGLLFLSCVCVSMSGVLFSVVCVCVCVCV